MYTTTRRNVIQKFSLVTLRTSDQSPLCSFAYGALQIWLLLLLLLLLLIQIWNVHLQFSCRIYTRCSIFLACTIVYALRGVVNNAASRASSDIILQCICSQRVWFHCDRVPATHDDWSLCPFHIMCRVLAALGELLHLSVKPTWYGTHYSINILKTYLFATSYILMALLTLLFLSLSTEHVVFFVCVFIRVLAVFVD